MRRLPQQQRSQALVASLLDATLLCIARDGLATTTTAKIARCAGVSVGSLYQYFDRKEDLYEALLERFVADIDALVDAEIARRSDAQLSEFVRNLLHAIWDVLERDDGRYLQLARHWNQMDSGHFLRHLEHKMLAVVSQILLRHPPARPLRDVSVKVYVLVNGIMLTLIRYIAEPAPNISRDALIEQFTALSNWMIRAG